MKSNLLKIAFLFITLMINNPFAHSQYIGSVTCFNAAERAGGEKYPYNQSLFLSNTGEAEWWDNIVEEIHYSGIDFSALLCRGYSPNLPSIDAGDPRKIPNMIAAMDRRGLSDAFKIAIFDDCPAGWTANHNYDQGRGHNTNTLFDCSDTANYKYIWDLNLKVAIENIPDDRRFKIDGRTVIFFWSVKSSWMYNIDYGSLKRIVAHIRKECLAEFGFDPYLIVSERWFENDTHLNPGDVDGVHNWFSSVREITWTLHSRGTLPKIGVTNPGIRYEGQPDATFNDPNHGETLISGLEGTVNSGAFITLCEGFTDAAETAAFWRSKDITYYDYPNQRLNILRRYSQNPFSNNRMIQAEACDFFHDLTPGNAGGTFRDGDLDIQKTSDDFGGWNVFDAEAEEWLEWKEIAIPKNPIFEIHYAAEESAQIQFILDEQEGSILSLAPTGGKQVWAISKDTSLNIPQNTYKNLKIKVISGKVSLNYFNIITKGNVGKVTITSPVSGTRYLQTDKISVKANVNGFAADIQKLELYVDSTFISDVSSSKIDTLLSMFTVGTHNIILKAIDENGNSAIDSCSIFIGEYSYTIESSIIGEGEIIFDPPGGTYIEGTEVLVKAKPAYSFIFDAWSGNTTSSENPLGLTMNADTEIIANFILDSNPSHKVNFQPNNSQVPDGYLKDSGLEYGLRDNGYVYGWIGGPNNETRDRELPDNNLYGTLNHMQNGGNHVWEMEVANGTYEVKLVMGDPEHKNQINTVNIEGTVIQDPDGEDNFDEYFVVAKVFDKRLTISTGAGADNAKICFVDIKPSTVSIENASLGPLNFELKQNYPNPFNQTTEIVFNLPKPGYTQLTVYNMQGQKIATLVNKKMDTGTYQVSFNAVHLPPGVYFYKLQSGEFLKVRKMLMHK